MYGIRTPLSLRQELLMMLKASASTETAFDFRIKQL
jgi:hypothetical protein